MANRHLSRTIVVQTLFEWDFNGFKKSQIEKITQRNIEEFGADKDDLIFIKNLVENILEKKEEIDTIIEKAAPEWPIDKISIIDRNVLRMGLSELLFADRKEVPPKVAINEAIEIAKTFSGPNSGKFVNGVLGAVYKEIGEPNKDETGNRQKTKIDISKLPIEKLGGAVVYSFDDNKKIHLALVHDVFGYWTLSKGHIEDGENDEEGTVREIKEELGIEATIKNKIGDNEYIASDPEKGKLRKQVIYYLAEAKFEELNLKESGGLDDAKWFSMDDLSDLKIYKDIMPIITKGIKPLIK